MSTTPSPSPFTPQFSETASATAPGGAYAAARTTIDRAHSEDLKHTADGRPAELVYANHMEAALLALHPEAPELLRLAARCQHLRRWSVPRASFPMDKVGYHAWRKSLYVVQADTARELLLAAGVPPTEADAVHTWVSKTDLRGNTGTQALEDAACLVFFQYEVPGFAADHPDFAREKYIDIIRKTWRKMSEPARAKALSLPLAENLLQLVREAVTSA